MKKIKKHFKASEVVAFAIALIVVSYIGRNGEQSRPGSADTTFDIGYLIGMLIAGLVLGLVVELAVAYYRSRKSK